MRMDLARSDSTAAAGAAADAGARAVDAERLAGRCARRRAASTAARLVALWGATSATASGGFASARRTRSTRRARRGSSCTLAATTPAVSRPRRRIFPAREPHAARGVRPASACASDADDQRPWLRPRRAGRRPVSRCAATSRRRRSGSRAQERLPVRPRRGRRRARDSGRPGARRHHRAGTLPLLRSSARRCCGSRSASATCTRASRSASRP